MTASETRPRPAGQGLDCRAIARPDDSPDTDAEPLASVVVCSRNGARTLARALASIGTQRFGLGVYEVILVDDASDDATPDIAAASGARVVRRQRSSGIGAARNAGVTAARGTIIVFTDDDCEPEPDWLEHLVAPLIEDPAVDGVSGATSVGSQDSIPFRFLDYRNPLLPLPLSLLDSAHPLHRLWIYLREDAGPRPPVGQHSRLYAMVGANMAVRRELLDAVGGFEDAMVQSEDEDVSRRIHQYRDGAVLVYEERARVAHHFRPGFGDTLRRARAYGRGSALTKRRSGEFPALFPFPLLTATVLIITLLWAPRRLPLALLTPLALYAGWWPVILRRRRAEPLLYPYMQLLQESAHLWGQMEYYQRPPS